jgi:GNAT superfamily N-acetyltransferase
MGRPGDKPGSIPYVPMYMYRPHLRDWPDAALPPGYAIRPFRAGEEADWARIEHAAGEFATPELARNHFDKEFGGRVAEMEERCLFVVDERNVPVGTTTAWYGDWDGRTIGRIHWVAIVPEHQGKKLAKPLLAHALRTLARFHERAYLSTQTTSWKAVGMYLDFGFEPALRLPGCASGWRLAERLLGRRIVTQDGSNGPGSQGRDLRGEP